MFHRFPLKEPERVRKWLLAVKRKGFKPLANSAPYSLHFKSTYCNPPVMSASL